MTAVLRVLHFEDSNLDAELVEQALGGLGRPVALTRAADALTFARALQHSVTDGPPLDLVLADYSMPDCDGHCAVQLVRANDPDVPVVIVTGTIGEERTAEVFRAGATDMVLKARLERLVPVVARVLNERSERRRARTLQDMLGSRTRQLQVMTRALSAVVEDEDWRSAANVLLTHTMAATASPRGFIAAMLPGPVVRVLDAQGLDGAGASDAWADGIKDLAAGRTVDIAAPSADLTDLIARVGRPSIDSVYVPPACGAPPPLTGERHVLATAFARREASVGVLVLEGKGGGYQMADVRNVEIVQEIGAIIFDSYRRSLEQGDLTAQLLQAQKLEAVGRLAGGVAHDFNNILTVVSGYAEMTIDELPEPHPLRANVMAILRAAQRATTLTRQLLLFSRKQAPAIRQADMRQIVRDFQKMLQRVLGEDVRLVIDLDAAACPVQVDVGQVEQVLMNLVVNARDAMPRGGQIGLSVHPVELDEAYVRRRVKALPGPHVRVDVSDTGTGMPPEVLAHIFEPFFTTKEPGRGTGLGLSTAYAIVDRFGGHFDVQSKPDGGTVFSVYFPASGEAVADAGAEAAVPTLRGSESILVVEDDPDVREMARQILVRAGYDVITQPGPREALDWWRSHPPAQLVLTDVVMPEMRGPEMIEAMRQTAPDMRVLYMSGYPEAGWGPAQDLDSLKPFVAKPFSPHSLLVGTREALSAPRGD